MGVYMTRWAGSLRLDSKVSSSICTHTSSCYVDCPDDDPGANDRLGLPVTVRHLLEEGPTTFCSFVLCSKPIFIQGCLELIPKEIQRSSWGQEQPEVHRVVSARFYCSGSCRNMYLAQSQHMWEKQLINSYIPWVMTSL